MHRQRLIFWQKKNPLLINKALWVFSHNNCVAFLELEKDGAVESNKIEVEDRGP